MLENLILVLGFIIFGLILIEFVLNDHEKTFDGEKETEESKKGKAQLFVVISIVFLFLILIKWAI